MVESSSMHSVPEVISGSLECRVLDKVPGDGQGVDSEGRDGTVVDRVLQPFFSIKSVAWQSDWISNLVDEKESEQKALFQRKG